MTRKLQILRGTTALNNSYTGSVGELTMDTTTNQIRIHDGTTVGGHIIGGSSLPSQTGNSGKFLITDGTNASWSDTMSSTLKIVDPNNSNKYTTLNTTGNLFTNNGNTWYRMQLIRRDGGTCLIITSNSSDDKKNIGASNGLMDCAFVKTLNNGSDITVPNATGTMVVTSYTGASQGQVLTLDSNLNAVWTTPSSGSTTLSGLTDVTISSATSGQVLTYDGSGWVNSVPATPANMQTTTNLVTSVSSSSTDTQYPSAKLFYDTCGDIETLINAL